MNTAQIQVRPDIGGMLHVIMTPENPLRASLWPAPMINNADGKPYHVDIHTARREHPNCVLVSYSPKDHSITCLSLSNSAGWYAPSILQGRLIEYALSHSIAIIPKNEGIDL